MSTDELNQAIVNAEPETLVIAIRLLEDEGDIRASDALLLELQRRQALLEARHEAAHITAIIRRAKAVHVKEKS